MATSAVKLKVMKKLVEGGYTDPKKIGDLSYRALKNLGLTNGEMDVYEGIANNSDKNILKYLFTDDVTNTAKTEE